MKNLFADIVVANTNVDRPFTYLIPMNLRDKVTTGCPVLIEFGKLTKKGYIIDIKEESDVDISKLKYIKDIENGELGTDENLLRLAIWIKHRYGVTFDKAISTVMPVKSNVEEKTSNEIFLNQDIGEDILKELTKKRKVAWVRLLKELKKTESLPQSYVNKELKVNSATIKRMVEEGYITVGIKQRKSNPLLPILKSLGVEDFNEIQATNEYILNEEQKLAVDIFKKDFDAGNKNTYLLHGITGSGKTLVFINMIKYVISKGLQAIVLIPEISLTYQTVLRMAEHFKDRVAIINSKLSKNERFYQFDRIKNGDADVIIGPRSAIFAPVKRLGLIVIDEEHDSAYKNENVPTFNVRDVAGKLANIAGASLLLASATPTPETYNRAVTGEIKLLELKERARNTSLPKVSIVDMRDELKMGNRSIFSNKLKTLIEDRLRKHEQVMLFMNRRGYSSFVSCRSCGEAIKCKHCDVTMTLHNNNKLVCHYCGYSIDLPKVCPSCGSRYIANFGTGTQKLEAMTREVFPSAKVLRMDTDSVSKKNSANDMIRDFARGDADILIGTQMIVKGHDFDNVTLVGIMAADTSLYVSNYNSAQRTFELLTQAAGRAGRAKSGEAVIQTYKPENYAIVAAAAQDYKKYFENEIAYRKLGGYPPVCHMLTVMFSSIREEELNKCATAIVNTLKSDNIFKKSVIIGPTDPSVVKVKDYYRKLVYIKNANYDILLDIQKKIEEGLGSYRNVGAVYDFN
ncbi:MAG: primosomal protein N' [Lachnospiraceae bacterium oral taxon 082]|nr:primosomal protein N' [Lachnospiraceae bacterium oral taxon 082]